MIRPEPRAEQDIFADLAELSARPGFVHVLAWISLRDNYVMFDEAIDGDVMAESYAPGRTVRTEFSTMLGLLVRQPVDVSEPSARDAKAMAERMTELLAELHERLGRPMWESIFESLKAAKKAGDERPVSPFTRADVLREPIFYGGESAYSFQYRDMAIERYAADEAWLLANKGFSIADAHAVATAIGKIQNGKILSTLGSLRRSSRGFPPLLDGFTVTADEIAAASGSSLETVRAVLAALSLSPPANVDFTSLGAFNLAVACPIIEQPDGRYIALQTYALVESLYDSPFYWMIADKGYRATASAHRGAFTEQFAAKRLSTVFGDARVHTNINIEGSSGRVSEMDVLVLFGDRAIIVQCKSKKMTLESRKGNDKILRDDFQKAVQDAYDQGLLCARSLARTDVDFVREDGSKLEIPELREIYIMCAVSDHYPVLTVQARHFLRYEQDALVQPPLVADIFLIDVLAEMLASPLRFLSYVHRRVGYAERVHGTNELAILGYHLRQNLWFEDETGVAMIDDNLSMDLDTAMTVRREGVAGAATPPGLLTRLEGTRVGRIIRTIEHEANPDLIDLGFLLLDINSDTIDQLDQGLKDVADRTRGDGKPHDFTLGFDQGNAGLTIHCTRAPANSALAALTEHCRKRKYRHRAASWFGLIVRETDSMPKFSIASRSPWEYDAKLESETRGMRLESERAPAISRRLSTGLKISRNDQCPCGSGKKFKKCCGS